MVMGEHISVMVEQEKRVVTLKRKEGGGANNGAVRTTQRRICTHPNPQRRCCGWRPYPMRSTPSHVLQWFDWIHPGTVSSSCGISEWGR